MSRASFIFVTATLFATSLFASSAAGKQQDFSDSTTNESFDDRMQLYSQWAQATHGRKLADALSPQGSPVSAPSPGLGDCKVLRYHGGYANLTLFYDKVIKDSPNFGECCHACKADPACMAWTRVAGGDPANFRNCYLKYNIDALDDSPDKYDHNQVGHPGDAATYPELRYVDPNFPTILESGTIPDVFPADYYGCPYSPGNAATPCDAPVGCNVNNGVQVGPACI